MASVWHPDKFKKIIEKLSKISYQVKNIITKNYSNMKELVWEKDSLNHGEMRHFCAHTETSFFFQFFIFLKNFRKNISHTLRYVSEDRG